jgi:hypothetical protein
MREKILLETIEAGLYFKKHKTFIHDVHRSPPLPWVRPSRAASAANTSVPRSY